MALRAARAIKVDVMAKKLTVGMADHEQKVLRDIEEYGLHVVLVREENELPGWAFSVGLYERFRHPEILVCGLPKDLSHSILNGMADEIRQGREFKPGFEYGDILENYQCIVHSVQEHWYPPFLGWARWFYEGDNFPVLQCFWPDKFHIYPWSPKFPVDLRVRQPLLFRWGVAEARVEGYLRSLWDSKEVDETKAVTLLRDVADSFTSKCTRHSYDPISWPFDNPKRIKVLAPQEIVSGSLFIANVFHDESDTWLVYPRSTKGLKGEPVEACLGCLYERDPSLAEIADLPRDWEARRKAPEDTWIRAQVPDE